MSRGWGARLWPPDPEPGLSLQIDLWGGLEEALAPQLHQDQQSSEAPSSSSTWDPGPSWPEATRCHHP